MIFNARCYPEFLFRVILYSGRLKRNSGFNRPGVSTCKHLEIYNEIQYLNQVFLSFNIFSPCMRY